MTVGDELLLLFVFVLELGEDVLVFRFGHVDRQVVEQLVNELIVRADLLEVVHFVGFVSMQLFVEKLEQIFVLEFDFLRETLRFLARADLRLQVVDGGATGGEFTSDVVLVRRRGKERNEKVDPFAEENTRLPFEIFQGHSTV